MAASPIDGNTAPPGYYMLSSQGVPSVAEWVQVGGGSAPPVGGLVTAEARPTQIRMIITRALRTRRDSRRPHQT